MKYCILGILRLYNNFFFILSQSPRRLPLANIEAPDENFGQLATLHPVNLVPRVLFVLAATKRTLGTRLAPGHFTEPLPLLDASKFSLLKFLGCLIL